MSDDQTIAAQEPPSAHEGQWVAPAWHLLGVLLLLFAAIIGSSFHLFHFNRMGHAGRLLIYILTIAYQWLMAAFIWWGCRLKGYSPSALLGKFAWNWRAILRDLGLAIAFLIVSNIVFVIMARLMHVSSSQAVRNILPHGGAEIAAYLLLALTAGICEEIIFRGYLQRQFALRTKSLAAGILLQGIVFGVAHSYQGLGRAIIVTVYGYFFGLLAHWRKSLRPGMTAHFLQDAIAGLMMAS